MVWVPHSNGLLALHMKVRLFVVFVVATGVAVLQTIARKGEGLIARGDALLVLKIFDFCVSIVSVYSSLMVESVLYIK